MYGLIGYPLGHSFSKEYFSKKFNDLKIDEEYNLFPIKDITEMSKLITFYSGQLKGLNVTIPYKELILKYLTKIETDAAIIGAVNVIKVIYDNGIPALIGYNTDWQGFLASLKPLLTGRTDIYQALVLGTGGASKAIAYALNKIGVDCTFVSRYRSNGDVTYMDLDSDIISSHRLIVNTTPLGTYPSINTCPDIPYDSISNNHICFDLVYNPEKTEFLKKCENRGATIKNGLEMLHIQADLSWQIWRNS